MAMTTEELREYLQNNTVTLDWASLTVVEWTTAARAVSALFRDRPRARASLKAFDVPEFETSTQERVSFKGLRLGTPRLELQVDTSGAIPAGEAVLFIPLVGGVYTVTTVANTVRYLHERFALAEHQGYGWSIRLPLAALAARVSDGRVAWAWDLDASKGIACNLGTVPNTRERIARALEGYVTAFEMLASPVTTHDLAAVASTPLSPQSVRFGLTASGEGDGVYALNAFASTRLREDEGSLPGPSFPFLLPKHSGAEGYEANAALYVAGDFEPFLADLTLQPADHLLSLLSPRPLMNLAMATRPEGTLDVAWWSQVPPGELPESSGVPRMSPAIATRLIGVSRTAFDSDQAHRMATGPVTLQAGGLDGAIAWRFDTWVPDGEAPPTDPIAILTPASDGRSATLQVQDHVLSGHYQLRVRAQDRDENTLLADVIVRPGSPTATVQPPVSGLNADGKAFFEVNDIISSLKVLGGAAQGEVEKTDDGFVYKAADSIEGAAVVLSSFGPKRDALAVADLTPEAAKPPRWKELGIFKLELSQGDGVYANGRQQLEVTITVGVQADGNGNYYPLSDAEMNSLELAYDTDAKPIEFLAPGETEMSETSPADYAQSQTRNDLYRFFGNTPPAPTPRSEGQGERTIKRYLMTRKPEEVTLVARFTSEEGNQYVSNIVDKNRGQTKGKGVEPPPFDKQAYNFTNELIGTPFPADCSVDGSVRNCLRSVTYWKLTHKTSNTTTVPFVRLRFDTVLDQQIATQSLMRWESDRMSETMFSYTGYAFAPAPALASALPTDTLDPSRMNYDPLLEWFMRLRHPEPGGDPARSLNHEVLTPGGQGRAVNAGELWVGLYRDDDTLFWYDGEQEDQQAPHPFRAFTRHLDGPALNVTLTDQNGNLHSLAIDFYGGKGTRGHRDALDFSVRSSPPGGGGTSGNAPPKVTDSQRLHSNAFNFASFVQGGVDPRTGLYSVALQLPELKANALAGPVMPLKLSYSPVSREDMGFGEGWSLNLTRYAATAGGNFMLSLHSGERYRVTGSGPMPGIEERKLEHFHFYADDNRNWRVAHLDGLVEYLELDGDTAWPKRWEAPSGHGVTLNYGRYELKKVLTSMVDDLGNKILSIDYAPNAVTLTAYPDATTPAVFRLGLGQGEVRSLALPVPEQAGWAFTYEARNGYRSVKTVRTPLGAREELFYNDEGHSFPDNRAEKLPRVTRHRVHPGQAQPLQQTDYSYERHEGRNFLGAGVDIDWQDDGLDNLYKADRGYTYGSTASHFVEGASVRTVVRSYNSFHLLTDEVSEQDGDSLHVNTEYAIEEKPFRDQPAHFQLPKAEHRTWKRRTGEARVETRTTTYDFHGQLLSERQPNGVRTYHLYFPAEGVAGRCPKDPYDFARQLRSTTVVPAQDAQAGAPVRVTEYDYQELPVLAASQAPCWIALARESLLRDKARQAPLKVTTFGYQNQPGDAVQHGRMATRGTLLNGFATTETFSYRLGDSTWMPQSVLHTKSILSGTADVEAKTDEQVSRKVDQEHSILTGLVLLERDDNDVEMRYQYDALQRVTREILAPGSDYEAQREYTYGLAGESESGSAWQIEQDVQGVQLLTVADGLGRAVAQWRSEPGDPHQVQGGRLQAPSGTQVYAAAYDALGQQVSETLFDNSGLEGTSQAFVTRFEYDGWGQRCAQLGPDGVRRLEATDPVGDGKGPTLTEGQESADGRVASARRVTALNLFEQPRTITRQLGEDSYDELRCDYDGLGRRVSQSEAWDGNARRDIRMAYDDFDREVTRTLVDGSVVTRRYSPHSSEDLPVHIDIAGKVLGTQAFDGLDRMIRATTGGRLRSFSYEASQTRPRTVTTPKGATLSYTYQPRLGEAPIQRITPGQGEERYDYDGRTARLMACHQHDVQVLTRTYHSNGQPKTETRVLDGASYSMGYDYSLGERLLSYTDVTGQVQSFTYDAAGRLCGSQLGQALRCTLAYDELARPSSVSTQDLASGDSLTTTLTYDALGRETERRFDYGDEAVVLTQAYDDADCITDKVLSTGDAELRREAFEYDPWGHLSSYTCTGPECPQDPYGNTLTSQAFICDELDNHLLVISTFTEEAALQARDAQARLRRGDLSVQGVARLLSSAGADVAEYHYDNLQDPAQLTRITRNDPLPGYPAQITLPYDEDGNLQRDDAGRDLTYDALGRLVSVSALPGETPSTYHYDPTDVISGRGGDSAPEHRFYQAGQLATLVQGEHSVQIVRVGEHLIAENHPQAVFPANEGVRYAN